MTIFPVEKKKKHILKQPKLVWFGLPSWSGSFVGWIRGVWGTF